MHLGSAARQGGAEIARQSAEILVSQSRLGHGGRRPRYDVPFETAATCLYRAARVGLVSGLSVPCTADADANASDRHGAVQVRRVQTERVDQDGAQPGLLETGSAPSRRD